MPAENTSITSSIKFIDTKFIDTSQVAIYVANMLQSYLIAEQLPDKTQTGSSCKRTKFRIFIQQK